MPSPTIAGFPALTPQGGPSAAALGEGTLSLRVVVRTPTVETFIQRYSRFVKDDRIFIFTKSEQPPGTRLRFTLELLDGRPLVVGEGTVTRVRGDTGDPNRPPGMELAFIPTDEASRKIVQLMLDERLSRGPKTASLTAPPVPPSPQLPVLPQTGAFDTIDRLAASPLLRGNVAGQHNDLPARPGTLRTQDAEPHASKMHAAVPTPSSLRPTPSLGGTKLEPPSRPTGPLTPLVVAAGTLPDVPHPEPHTVEPSVEVAGVEIDVPSEPEPSTPPVSSVSRLTESTVAALFDIGAPPEPPAALDWSLPDEAAKASPSVVVAPEPATSRLDSGSLFASSAGHSPTPSIDHTPLPIHAPPSMDAIDELSQSFPGLAAAPTFAEGWRRADTDPNTVPANPFSEVSDNAIEYFVEWSLERSTGAAKAVGRASAAFGTVAMKPPEPETRDRGMRFGLVVGLAVGALVGGATAWVVKPAPPAPQALAIVAPVRVAEPVAVVAPPPPKPTPAPVPAVAKTELTIDSYPAGAAVTIDGTAAGKTPLKMPLVTGPHDVVLKLDRYADYEATVDAPGTLDAALHRPRGTLKITSNPPGADVLVGGEAHGKTPTEVALPAYESYTVEVSLNGKSWKRKLYVKPPSTSVQATLAAHSLPTRAQSRATDVRSAGIR